MPEYRKDFPIVIPLSGGRRSSHNKKKYNNTDAIISIITVVYNGAEYIEKTILSVIRQTYSNVEYIIIDGGSTDGTLQIIQKYDHDIDFWISEKDQGIYDAMNKGIDHMSGDWVNFMNAGDIFCDEGILTSVFHKQHYAEHTVLFGDHFVRYDDLTVKRRAGAIENLWKGSQFCHQSAFIKGSFHQIHRYNRVNKITADFEFFFNASISGNTFFRLPQAICIFSAGGVSDINRTKSIISWFKVVCEKEFSMKILSHYCWLIGLNWTKGIVKSLLPRSLLRNLRS
jgi:glycosyltransferase involved in cell wall biosynthesis